jgi:3',5'-cyclic AMP phosphodiesterase CpdA
LRTLVHLSDLHFGRVDEALLGPLVQRVTEIQPDIVVVSGDLTQRARTQEFKQASRFLASLPSPQIVVPGNHDVPLHNIFTRFYQPLDKFQRYITSELEPFYADAEIAIAGVNSARSLTIKSGRINEQQIARIRERFCALEESIIKIIVTHHPFDLPDAYHERHLVGRAPQAMATFANCGVDILLAGHMHISNAGNTAERYKMGNYSALVVQAGTATSTRIRDESNSFNVIKIQSSSIDIDRLSWQPNLASFSVLATESFQYAAGGWSRVTISPPA